MTSILKVDNIKDSADNQAISISNGVATFTSPPLGLNANITTETTVATTSGTEVDFFNIPSTVKRITILFRGISVNDGGNFKIQLGTSSGLTSSGYASISSWGAGGVSDTTGFALYGNTSNLFSGLMTICHMGSNVYISSHAGKYNTSNGVFGGGDVALSGILDRLRIRPTTGSFDAGSVNIMYES